MRFLFMLVCVLVITATSVFAAHKAVMSFMSWPLFLCNGGIFFFCGAALGMLFGACLERGDRRAVVPEEKALTIDDKSSVQDKQEIANGD